MKILSRTIVIIVAVLCILVAIVLKNARPVSNSPGKANKPSPYDELLARKLSVARLRIEQTGLMQNARGSAAFLVHSKAFLSEAYIARQVKANPAKLAGTVYWSAQNDENATASAMGIDFRHHFVNHYLVGYQPFPTKNVWLPLYTLAKNKVYEYDKVYYNGQPDVWQTSKQAFYFTRGDCEDHALALADWLIEMGEDARVVLGTYKNEGHAWVILFKGKKEFLLEATSKAGRRSINTYPLAKMKPEYQPWAMFNRSFFWLNQGPKRTTKYNGQHWEIRSRYYRNGMKS